MTYKIDERCFDNPFVDDEPRLLGLVTKSSGQDGIQRWTRRLQALCAGIYWDNDPQHSCDDVVLYTGEFSGLAFLLYRLGEVAEDLELISWPESVHETFDSDSGNKSWLIAYF